MDSAIALRERPPALPAARPPARDRPGAGLADRARRAAPWGLLGAYALQLAIIVPRHEPWFDEAQAWLLARDSGVVELFADRLRYEGNPGLWHLLLVPLAKLGAPYAAMSWLAAAIAVAGAAVLVRAGPFPRWATAGLLFSFALGYQEAVVARGYVLLPVLLFAVAATWPRRGRRVARLTALLSLIAGVSLHGLLIAGALAAVRALEVHRGWAALRRDARLAHLAAAAALAAQAAVTAAVLWPPADIASLAGDWDVQPETMLWVLDRSLTGTGWLTAAALALTVPWLARQGALALWAAPTGLLLLLMGFRYHAPHHEELLFLTWLAALWVAFGRPGGDPRLRRAALAGLAIVLVVQVSWWARSWAYDWAHPYSGAPALAAHLAALPPGTEVWAADWPALAALPYLEGNVYANFNGGRGPSYWVWREDKRTQLDDGVVEVHLRGPDVWVWPVKSASEHRYPDVPGYRRVAVHPGGVFSKDGVYDHEAFVVYERRSPRPSS